MNPSSRFFSNYLGFARIHPFIVIALIGLGALLCQNLSGAAPGPGFFSARTVLWQGRTQIIPVGRPQPGAADETFSASSSDASVAEVLQSPTFLAGETTAYLRVRALRQGRTRISLQWGGGIDAEVKADPAADAMAQIAPEQGRPRIVSPVAGATVWGQFAVGVEIFDSPVLAPGQEPPRAENRPPNALHAQEDQTPAPEPDTPSRANAEPVPKPARPDGFKVQLRLPGGQLLDPVAQTPPESGPVRQYAFTVSAADLPAGAAQLVAVATPASFSDVDRRADRSAGIAQSEPLALNVLPAPKPDALWIGECESVLGETRDALAPARPAHFGVRQPQARPDAAASGGKTVACPGNDPAWCMPFIVKQPGDYQLFLQMRGDIAAGAYPTMALYLNASERPRGFVRLVSNKYQRLPIGAPIALEAGPQVLTVQFKNDFSAGKEDRNAYLDRYELVRVGDSAPVPDEGKKPSQPPAEKPAAPAMLPVAAAGPATPPATAPRLEVLYPANGAEVFGVDAVVARAAGGMSLAWADLLVDGQPQGLRCQNPPAGDALVFPLILRGMPPGSHRVSVRCAGHSGQESDAPVQLVNVLAQAPAAPGHYECALRLLDRLAYGPEPQELAAILTMSEITWLNQRLAAGFDAPAEQAALRAARARYPKVDDGQQTASRALHQWMASDNPVRARFTVWAENHFSTWMSKTNPGPKWSEHFAFSQLGIAPFFDLLSASAHSPAMLTYLDQEKSYAGRLNENYAREIMELHTLGVHGGYRQTDVTALANVLNGWTLVTESILPEASTEQLVFNDQGNEAGLRKDFRFAPALNDGKPQRVFGMQFPAADPAARCDRVRIALEMLASHPSTADHVCRQLAEHYVGVPAPDGLVKAMARTFLESGGDMRAAIRTMASHPGFWKAPPKLATPMDFGLRIARLCRAAAVQTGADPDQAPKADQITGFLKRSGMGLFDRISPDGYPENSAAYADSNALLQRWRFTQTLVEPLNRLVPLGWRVPAPTPSDDPNRAAAPVVDPAQRFVDLAAVRLTGRLLSPTSNQAALEVLGGQPNPDHTRQAMVFISLLPEVNLR